MIRPVIATKGFSIRCVSPGVKRVLVFPYSYDQVGREGRDCT